MKGLILAAVAIIALQPAYAQTFNTLYTFSGELAGYGPDGVPYIGAGGVLFGATAEGGANVPCNTTFGCGTVFSLTPPSQDGGQWTAATPYSFQGPPDGSVPGAGVLPGPNGTLLGTTAEGGPASIQCRYGCGTLFQLTPPTEAGGAWTESVLYDFVKADYEPYSLLSGANGVLFGVAKLGGNKQCSLGCGSIYELFPPTEAGADWSLTSIHQFSTSTGAYPVPPLAMGVNGVLYGAVSDGGDNNRLDCPSGCGTVFSLTPPVAPATAWTFQDVYRFKGGSDGFEPETGLTMGPDGTLYGTTYYGGGTGCAGELGCGTVFSLAPPVSSGELWTKTTLYAFQGGNDGSAPNSSTGDLVVGPDGVIYGVTEFGGGTGCGGQGCGTLFQLTPPSGAGGSWAETILHAFTGMADGKNPQNGPAIDPNGVLYGFAYGGTGTSCFGGGCGVVYQYIP